MNCIWTIKTKKQLLNSFLLVVWWRKHPFVKAQFKLLSTDLRENLWSDIWLGIEEVQHVARMLNAVLCCLLWGGEAVVPGTMEVFETACAIFQLIALARDNCLLLGHTAKRRRHCTFKMSDIKRFWTHKERHIKNNNSLPDVHSLRKEEGVVQVSDGAVHSVAVSHFHHRCSRFTLHELDLWDGTGLQG